MADLPESPKPAESNVGSEQCSEAAEEPKKELSKNEELPKLSAHDFRIYNRMSEHMDMFHNNFRLSWNTLYSACANGRRPAGMTMRQFIFSGLRFCQGLTFHHDIEEQHIFPLLGKRMPAFKKDGDPLKQHKQIHAGLDKLEAYLEECQSGAEDLRMDRMKEIMDSFGAVLWAHLDDEVRELGAENMRKYWSKDEIMRMPM
ncbi:hypothetical protein BDY21DRAFT_282800 [Lineolata rhizophorae]|uniref:Hemerythrin-like domain-containing protein n=1 Tax=Lineolata rhizophorae TaxID=578093 RepID=A0A6A6P583_9PEZI|nr:hypothetical protein BDY21DRAFT_282800 [Lineolata rhizophorae]